ncbi:MAG: ATP-binding protein [Verrucomicrobiales bacterium]
MALSFRLRIALWSALLSGIVLLIFFGITALMVFDTLREEVDDKLLIFTQQYALVARDMDEGRVPQMQQVATLSAERDEGRLIELVDAEGKQKYHDPGWPEPGEEIKYLEGGMAETIRYKEGSWRVMSRTFARYRVRMAIDLAEIRAEVWKMIQSFLKALPIALVFIGVGAWWVAGRAVKPIQKIIATAEHITPEGLAERIEGVESHDELGRLARVLNRMMERIEVAFHQTRRFSADASHELRTPLAVMQGKIEVALQEDERSDRDKETLAELLGRVGQLRSIIDSLLMLSRSDAGSLTLDRGELDLHDILADVTEDAEIISSDEGISLTTYPCPSGTQVNGDGRLLRLAISNLLTNAIKYNISERGEISSGVYIKEGFCEIVITNTGPEISEENRDRIFERFYRGDPARGAAKRGFGLGLSLSRVIASAHGGKLELVSSREGRNSFVMTLPIVEHAESIPGDHIAT